MLLLPRTRYVANLRRWPEGADYIAVGFMLISLNEFAGYAYISQSNVVSVVYSFLFAGFTDKIQSKVSSQHVTGKYDKFLFVV